jgi:hypothetical protein
VDKPPRTKTGAPITAVVMPSAATAASQPGQFVVVDATY